MKIKLTSYIAIIACASLVGCATVQLAIPGVISAGLRYGIKDDAKRTVIANYICVVAKAARSVGSNMSPDELTAYINSFIPANVRTAYPEIEKLGTPIVVAAYKDAVAKYGQNFTKVYAVLAQVADWLEAGAAPYISHT
jgi:hypothetical protein